MKFWHALYAITIYLVQTASSEDFQCEPAVTAAVGGTSVTVPKNGQTLPAEFKCVYLVTVAPSKAIQLKFDKFKFGNDAPCTDYYVEVGKGDNPSTSPGTKYCGTNPPPETTYKEPIYVNVVTKNLPAGHELTFTATQVEPPAEFQCEPAVTAAVGGTSVTVPKNGQTLPAEFKCVYLVTVAPSKAIQLKFDKFKFGKDAPCTDYYVEVGKGDDPSSSPGTRYCGTKPPPDTTYKEEKIYVNLVTKNLPAGHELTFTATQVDPSAAEFACDSKTYEASDYVQNLAIPPSDISLPAQFDCTYEIKALDGRLLDLQFVQFKMGTSEKCDTEYVTITENKKPSEEEQQKLCGQKTPNVPINKVPVVYVHVKGTKLTTEDGFILSYKSDAARKTPVGILMAVLYLIIYS